MFLIEYWLSIFRFIIALEGALFNSKRGERAVRSHDFTELIHGFKMSGAMSLGFNGRVPRVEGCASLCALTPGCKSINHCGRTLCTLNNIDRHNPRQGKLAKDVKCTYGGMKQIEMPICVENGIGRLIFNQILHS